MLITYSVGTTDWQRFTSAQHTTISLSVTVISLSLSFIINLIGRISSNILYFCFTILIILSTCILILANSLDSFSSFGLSCGFPLVNAGFSLTNSVMFKPVCCAQNLQVVICLADLIRHPSSPSL